MKTNPLPWVPAAASRLGALVDALRRAAPAAGMAICMCMCALGTGAWAQTAPDAGALQRQLERDALPPLPQRGAAPAAQPPATLTLPDDATLEVNAFAFDGNTLLDDAQLQAVVQPWLGRSIGFADLQAASRVVAEAYRDAGWIVSTYLPRQDVTEGRVLIRVVEARFDGARIEEPQPARMRAERVLSYFDAAQPQGQPLSSRALDRALLLADDLPGVAVAGVLEPGAAEGRTGIALRVVDEPLLAGDVGLDNAGARSTGAERLTLGLRLANPTGYGDLAALQAMKSRGTQYGRLDYSLPVGARGLRAGAHLSAFDYRLVGADWKPLRAEGSADSVGLNLQYPLLRSRLTNVYAQLSLDHKQLRNKASGTTQSRYRVQSASVALTGNHFDDLLGGGSTRWALTLVDGRVAQGHVDAGENPALAGSFSVLRWSLARQQVLAPAWTLALALSGQEARRDLDSSERMYLGGAAGVRAYPVNEGSGSRGAMLNADLRWRLQPELQAGVFFDIGRVTSRDAATPRSTLKGVGVTLQWSTPIGIEASLTLAHRIGRNPHPAASGRDQDGSLTRLRPWLQLSFAF